MRRVRLRDMRDEMRDEGGESKLSTQYSNTVILSYTGLAYDGRCREHK